MLGPRASLQHLKAGWWTFERKGASVD